MIYVLNSRGIERPLCLEIQIFLRFKLHTIMNNFLENLTGTSALKTARFVPAAPEEPENRKRARETTAEQHQPIEQEQDDDDSEGEDFSALAQGAATAADDGTDGRGDAGDDNEDQDDAVAPFMMEDEEDDEEDDEDDEKDDVGMVNKYTVVEEDPMAGLDTSLIIEGGRRRKRARVS